MIVDWRLLPEGWKDIPTKATGVYFLIDRDDVAYIGRSTQLRTRLRSHNYSRTEVREGIWKVRVHFCSPGESVAIEKACIRHYRPKLNIRDHPGFIPAEFPSGPFPNLRFALAAYRKFKDMTEEEIAAELNISCDEYSSFERDGSLSGPSLASVISAML